MPRPRFDRLPPERRDKILDVAAREFGSRGYHGASLNKILDAAGVSKGAAYYYFDDKADLFAAVIDRFVDRVISIDNQKLLAVDRSSYWTAVREIYASTVVRSWSDPWGPALAKAVMKLPAEARKTGPLARPFERAYAKVAAVIRRGREIGAIRTDLPEDLVLGLFLAMDEATDRWVCDHPEQLTPEATLAVYDRLVDGMQRMFLPPGDPS